MVKLTVSNLSSKVGKRVDMAKVEEINVAKKQIDQVDFSMSNFKCLKKFDLSGNRIRFPRQLTPVLDAPILEELNLNGNPIAREKKDFRLFVIAHSSITLNVLNGEEISDTERCEAWLKFPEKDPFLNPSLKESLAKPISDALIEAYAQTGQAAAENVEKAKQAALAAKQAEQEALERKKAELAKDKEDVARRHAEEQAAAEAARKEHERLLREARLAERQVAVDAGLIEAVSEPEAVVEPSVAVVSDEVVGVKSGGDNTNDVVENNEPNEQHTSAVSSNVDNNSGEQLAALTESQSNDDQQANQRLFADNAQTPLFGTSIVEEEPMPFITQPEQVKKEVKKAAAPATNESSWWTSQSVLDDDDAMDTLSIAERARARIAEKKKRDEETRAKMRAVAAARRASKSNSDATPQNVKLAPSSTTSIKDQSLDDLFGSATSNVTPASNDIVVNKASVTTVDVAVVEQQVNVVETNAVDTKQTTLDSVQNDDVVVEEPEEITKTQPIVVVEEKTEQAMQTTTVIDNSNVSEQTTTTTASLTTTATTTSITPSSSTIDTTNNATVDVVATKIETKTETIVEKIDKPTTTPAPPIQSTPQTSTKQPSPSIPSNTVESTTEIQVEKQETTVADGDVLNNDSLVFESSREALAETVARHERQLAALKAAGGHLVAQDKAIKRLDEAKRRLQAFDDGGLDGLKAYATAAAAAEGPKAKRNVRTLDTRLKVEVKKGSGASIFDDLDDMFIPKPQKKSTTTKKKTKMPDLFGDI